MALFIGENVATKFNFDYKLLISLLIVICFIIITISKSYKRRKVEVLLSLFVVSYSFYKIIFDGSEGTRMLGLAVILPPLAFISFPEANKIFKARKHLLLFKQMMKIFFIFYIVECLIAIFEHFSHNYIFSFMAQTNYDLIIESLNFRSLGIHGHPLQNALIVSIFMTYLLVSPIKLLYKYSLWLLGFFAILSFNGRASILICCLTFAIFIAYNIAFIKDKISKKVLLISVLSLFVISSFYLINNGTFGGRLKNGIFDESSQVRFDIWRIFKYYDISDFIFGIKLNKLLSIMYKYDLYATENFWLDWFFLYGAVFLGILLILYFSLFKKIFKDYLPYKRVLLIVSFLAIASSNNSLSVSPIPLIFFLLCNQIFHPEVFFKILNKKYIETNTFSSYLEKYRHS